MCEIVKAFQRLEIADREWLKNIENRPTGSQWGRFMPWQEIAGLPWEKMPDSDRIEGLHNPRCDYYHAQEGLDPATVENIKLLAEFENLAAVYIDRGPHGIELLSREVKPRPTSEAWLIIGPPRGTESDSIQDKIVWTAYPGKFAATVTMHPLWNGDHHCLEAIARSNWPIAVKGLKPADQQ